MDKSNDYYRIQETRVAAETVSDIAAAAQNSAGMALGARRAAAAFRRQSDGAAAAAWDRCAAMHAADAEKHLRDAAAAAGSST